MSRHTLDDPWGSGPLAVRCYRPTPRFDAIEEHVCAARPDGTPVALCGPAGDPRSEADARLFSAAPDLAAAADETMSALNLWFGTDNGADAEIAEMRLAACRGQLRAALAKARGEGS